MLNTKAEVLLQHDQLKDEFGNIFNSNSTPRLWALGSSSEFAARFLLQNGFARRQFACLRVSKPKHPRKIEVW